MPGAEMVYLPSSSGCCAITAAAAASKEIAVYESILLDKLRQNDECPRVAGTGIHLTYSPLLVKLTKTLSKILCFINVSFRLLVRVISMEK